MEEEPLPLATYAKLLAHLVCHRDQPLDKVLGALGVTLEQLHRADAYYNDRLAESHRLRKGVLAMTFASAFAEARKAQGLFTGEPAPTPILPAAAASEPQAKPSYMSAPAPGSLAAPPPPVTPPPAIAPPAILPPAAVTPPLPPPVLAPSAPIPPSVAMSPSMPVPPPAPAPAPVHQPPASLVQTSPTTGDVPIVSPPASAMPFRPAAPGATSSAPPSGPASAAPRPPGPGTGTALSPGDGPRLPDTPWDQAASRVGKLTLAHYAALTVELSRNPADLTPLYQRYGLSGPDDLRHVQAAFQTQMHFDAALRAQFEALVGRMRSMSSRRDG